MHVGTGLACVLTQPRRALQLAGTTQALLVHGQVCYLDSLVGMHSLRASGPLPMQETEQRMVGPWCRFTPASTALLPLQEEKRMPAHSSARGQDLLQVPGQHHRQDSLHGTHACDVDPVVVIVMQIPKVEAMTAILVSRPECICCLQKSRAVSVNEGGALFELQTANSLSALLPKLCMARGS